METPDYKTLLAQCRADFGAALVLAAGEVGVRSPALTQALTNHAEQAFDELAGLHSKEEFVRLRGLTASRISLVHPEDMDLTVALINLSHDLADACDRHLPRLHLLFMRLLGQDSSVLDQLPVGPDAVCVALRGMCDQGELVGQARLDLPSRIKGPLTKTLQDFYSRSIDALHAAGIEPQTLTRSDGGDSARSRPLRDDGMPDGEGMGYGGAGQESLTEARRPDGPLDRLQGALLRRRGGGGSGYGSGGNVQIDPELLAAIIERVVVWLSERQKAAAALPYGTGGPAPSFAELNSLLPASNNAALDAIGLTLDALNGDPDLCEAIKPSLERLRLPLSKLALLDANVLAETGHPARQFIDTLLRLSMTLTPEATAEDPLCKIIETTTHRVQQEFDREPGVFELARTDLLAFDSTRRDALVQRCLALVAACEREAQREHSRSRAARAVRALCADDVPGPVRAFLEQLWVRVLAAIHQHVGEKSEPWMRALATANQLVESVQPRPDAVARQQLLASLPGLLTQLRAGLEAIGTPETLRERAFHSFVECHKAVVAGVTPHFQNYDRLEVGMAVRIEAAPDVPGLSLVRLAPEPEGDQRTPEWLTDLKPGQWLQLNLPGEPQRRLCIGWFGGSPRLLAAIDPAGDYAILFPQRWLLRCLADKQAYPVTIDGVFERAAENAIARCR